MSPLPTGLRARKRQQTYDEILANAIALFRKGGIRGARMSEIAQASGVSAGTLFNYFPTKSVLAEAWVRGEIEQALTNVADSLGDRSLRPTLRAACGRLAELGRGERALRLEAWREVGRARRDAIDEQAPMARVLRREQERERVRGDLPATVLYAMLQDAIEGGVIEGLRRGDPDAGGVSAGAEAAVAAAVAAETASCLRARVDLVLDGARKRNERVAAPPASSARGA